MVFVSSKTGCFEYSLGARHKRRVELVEGKTFSLPDFCNNALIEQGFLIKKGKKDVRK